MNEITNVQQQAIEDLLLILSEFYKPPTEEFFQALKNGLIEDELREKLQHLSPFPSTFNLIHPFESFESMRKTYQITFLGPKEPYALPIESIYKVWTTDPSAELLIAGEKGHLFGDSAIHLRYLYQQFGIEIPKEFEKMPDHLTLLLEFLALLMQMQRFDLMERFIQDHFDWIDSFIAKLKSVPGSDFYVLITELVGQVIHTISKDKEV